MFSEQDVDRELKAALSVSPSPDFEARVLRQVEAARPSRSFAAYGWLAAAASVVVAAGLFYELNQPTTVVEEPGTRPVVARTEPPPAPVPMTPTTTKQIESPRVARVRSPAPARAAEPEVLVPVNQMEAVRRLVRAVNEGRIAAPTERVEAPVGLPKEVVVAPLVIDPIPVPAVEPDADAPFPINRGH